MASETAAPDEFQLFDLRVEVVCPPGKRIMCGAKEGDHFTLKGEMLYLPPDQGISIYSLGMSSFQKMRDGSAVNNDGYSIRTATSRGQAESHPQT